MPRWVLWLLCSIFAIARAQAQDAVGFGPQDTCQVALEAETAKGASRLEPPALPYNQFGNLVFHRTQNGAPASVIYLCNGVKPTGGPIFAQIIRIERSSEDVAQSEFKRQVEFLRHQFGEPCWNGTTLTPEQRASIPEGFTHRMYWRVRSWAITDIGWWEIKDRTPRVWGIVINTGWPWDPTHLTEPSRTIWSKCGNPG